MTSHIFTRIGSWQESIDYNERAAKAAMKHRVNGSVSMHFLHAADYLAYAHLQRGDDEAAEQVWSEVLDVEEPVQSHAATAYAYAAIPARLALERQDWTAARELSMFTPSGLVWDSFPHLQAITFFANGLGAARSGDVGHAAEAVGRLRDLEDEARALPGTYDWGTQVEIQRRTLDAWIVYASGDEERAEEIMRDAAALESTTSKNPVTPGAVLPAAELLGDMLLERGKAEEALEAYESSLARTRNRLNSLYGAAVSAAMTGDTNVANSYYEAILSVVAEDSDLPLIQKVRARSNT